MILPLLFTLAFGTRQISLPAAPGPLDNPMKGFASYCEPGESLYAPTEMAFEEIGWDKLEPEKGHYAFEDWENNLWDKSPAAGKHVVLRVYLDYPSKPTSVPKWLIAEGVKMTKYDEFGGGLTPDYEDPRLLSALMKFIKAFGARYDHNSRVDYIQVGLLGHWGEWHTYPHDKLFASPKVQGEVVAALHTAFPDKPLMARNASYASCQLPWIGFHDDMIPSDTFGKDDWEFLPAIEKGGVSENWKVAPTGGEMVPGAAKQYLGTDWSLLMKSVRDAHFTWIGPYCPAMVSNLTSTDKERVDELIRTLGYEYRLASANLPLTVTTGDEASIKIDGVNQGSAPFYQPWKVTLALLDENKRVAQSWQLGDDVRKWTPGIFNISANQRVKVTPGKYSLAIGIIDPESQKPKIRFANRLDESEGFTILGNIEVVKPLTN